MISLLQQLPGPLAVESELFTKTYRGKHAVKSLNLTVPVGATYVLVGPNGSGKSTTLKGILGLIVPNKGSMRVFGRDISTAEALVRANIGYVPESIDWGNPSLRADKMLELHSALYRSWDHSYADKLCRVFDVQLGKKLKSMSKGERRRVHLVMALAAKPQLLLLDEPTDGLDPLVRDEAIRTLVEHIALYPTTVVISTHRIEEVQNIVTHVGVMSKGSLISQLSAEDLRSGLLRYTINVPEGWTNDINAVRTEGIGSQRILTVSGNKREVVNKIESSGAEVTDVSSISLFDATVSLLRGSKND